ncbi:hypothetical protein ONZ45_g6593 [Pleurotus djamor]|nr:hypothetical protein ONZ45_g6593 [Pleurotus djamor]
MVSTSPPEADLSKPAAWVDDNHSNDALAPPRPWKGKGRSSDPEDDDAPLSDAEASDASIGGSYPPNEDDEADTRRVQENLRRWEVAERQRRKAARDSVLSTTTPSLMSDVSRRASLLWSNRKPTHPVDSGDLGKHTVLNSRESIDVPLENIASASSPAPSPTPTAATSPFADAQARNPFLASSEYLPPSAPLAQGDPSTELLPSDAQLRSSSPPPPRPLNLPPPRTPPPRIETPDPTKAPPNTIDSTDKGKETRWWHEILCGCSEGPDRGGDYQAGRTNPFE